MKRFLSLFLSLCMLCTLLPAVPVNAAADAANAVSYEIAELSVNGGGTAVTTKLTAAEDCTLVTALYERSGKMFSVSTTPVTGQSAEQTLDVPVDSGSRTRFTVKSFLTDDETGAPLCENAVTYYADWMSYTTLSEIDVDTVVLDETSDLYYRSDILNFFTATGASVYDIDDAIASVGGEVVGRVPLLDLLQVRVEAATLPELDAKADALSALECINYAYAHTLIPFTPDAATPVVPDDPWGTLLGDDSDWTDDDVDSNNWWIEYVKGQYAWDYSEEFGEITVGVIDGSFDIGHEDLKNVASFATPELAAANDSTPWWVNWSPKEDHAWDFDQQRKDQLNTHGTHVAGIIGAEANNGKGITGLAWSPDLMFAPIPSLDGNLILENIAMLVQNGAKVINVSAGASGALSAERPTFTNGELLRTSVPTAEALAKVIERGYDFIVVQSAGNGRSDGVPVDAIQNCMMSALTEDTPLESETVSIYDVMDRCLVVTATEVASNKCIDYANYGTQVDIAAPGASIYSTLPGDVGSSYEFTGSYGTLSGTSMAAPMVTAVCAMVWATCEWLSPEEVCNIVTISTDTFAYSTADTTNYPMLNAQLAVETASQYNSGKIPLEINVQYADGTPASGVAIEGTGLAVAPVTNESGSTLCFVEPDRYLITANPEGWYDEQDVTITRKTTVNLTLEETWFDWSLDETGKHLTIDGYGPMPDYYYKSSTNKNLAPWGTAITSATVSGVADIGDLAFYECYYLTDVEIADSVRKIGEKAFYYNASLKSITLPDRLFDIGSHAFYGNSLSSLTVPGYVYAIGDYAFYLSQMLTSLTLENGIVRIGDYAFCASYNLPSLHVPSSVVEIGSGAFSALQNASSITLAGGNLKTIGEGAFSSCDKLTSFTIPSGVTVVPGRMFADCYTLERVTIPEGVTAIEAGAFSGCSGLKSAKLPSTLTELGKEAFMYCRALESISIPDGVTLIWNKTFYNCTALKEVTLPKNLTGIYTEAFYNCTSLAEISFPATITRLDESAFENCDSLENLTIPFNASLSYVFSGCTGLKSVTFMNGFTQLGSNAFRNCSSLTDINLPSTLEAVFENAFYNCALSNVYYAGSSANWANVYVYDSTLKNASITYLG